MRLQRALPHPRTAVETFGILHSSSTICVSPPDIKSCIHACLLLNVSSGRCGHDRWLLDLQLPMQSVSITTNVVSLNPAQARFTRYNIILYSLSVTCTRSMVFTSTPISSTNKIDCHNITEILLKVALNTITLTTALTVSSLFLCK